MFKKASGLMALALAAVLLVSCGTSGQGGSSVNKKSVTSDTLYVQKVENLPEDFILGMDASCVPA